MTNGQMILILIAIFVCCLISTVIIVTYICQVTKMIIETIFDTSEINSNVQVKLTKKLLGIKEEDNG
ncbi:hypothetical protein [Lentilactobacillus senioris]|uniref:hypothetical protein n=1 Tax=Lentilactobacillus senioris TaxID=931534 RepID=UPI003D2D337F